MAGKTGNILALYDVLYRRTDEDHPLTMREIQTKWSRWDIIAAKTRFSDTCAF